VGSSYPRVRARCQRYHLKRDDIIAFATALDLFTQIGSGVHEVATDLFTLQYKSTIEILRIRRAHSACLEKKNFFSALETD